MTKPLRTTMLKYRYGITELDWLELLAAQGGRCAICRSSDPKSGKGWHTDHDHNTGWVRGILCHQCNNDLVSYERLKNYPEVEAYLTKQEQQVGFKLDERIMQVRAMEDFIEKKQEALDAELEQHHKFVETGRAEILHYLNTTGQKSANTEYGGCHWKPKITYRVEDKDAFRRHVIGAEAWELITWASAPVNCESFTEEHKMPPPGLVRNAVNILYITPPTKPKTKNKVVKE